MLSRVGGDALRGEIGACRKELEGAAGVALRGEADDFRGTPVLLEEEPEWRRGEPRCCHGSCEREQGAGCDRQATGAVVNSSSANPSSGGGKDNIPATKRRNSSLILLLFLLRGLDQGQPRQRDPKAQELSAEKKKEEDFAQNEVSSPRKEMTESPSTDQGYFFPLLHREGFFHPIIRATRARVCVKPAPDTGRDFLGSLHNYDNDIVKKEV